MNDSARARALEAAHNLDLDLSALPRIAPVQRHPPLAPRTVLPSPPRAAARSLFYTLWLRVFGPPAIDPRCNCRELGAFRAFAEIGSDYLPSSGTWPASTSDRS